MTFVSYAQNFEDVMLWRALNDVAQGQYLDIGAQDPDVDSVSRAFYEAGWLGIHVEPTPAYAAKLRVSRPNEVVIEAAVSDAAGPIEFFEIEGTGISTGRPDIAEHHARSGLRPRKILIPTIRLDALLRTIKGDLHWLKVDVEGMESDVLRSWGDSPARPWLLVIESTFPNSQRATHEDWIEYVRQRGYREVFYDGLSRYFLHRSQGHREAAFSAPPNVFDCFSITQDHFSADALRRKLQEADERFCGELECAAALRDAAEASAAVAIQSEQQARNELAVAAAKEISLLTRIADAEREYAVKIDSLWREHRAAEASLRDDFKAANHELQQALKTLRYSDSEARAELARTEERAKGLERDLIRKEQEHQQFGREREQRDTEIAALTADLGRAETLMRDVLRAPLDGWQRIGRQLRLSRTSPAIEALDGWLARNVERRSSGDKQFLAENPNNGGVPRMNSKNPYLRANSLVELLDWDDLDFVRCAYVTVLGRQPDPTGEAYYANRIRRGHSKMEILWQLRRSPEGPSHDPGIAGLDRALRRARWERSRAGWLVRPFTHGGVEGASARPYRVLVNKVGRLEANQVDLATGIENAIATFQREMAELSKREVSSLQKVQQVDAEAANEVLRFLESQTYGQISPTTQRIFRKLIAA